MLSTEHCEMIGYTSSV